MEWLANIKIQYVIAAVVILFAARMVLGKYKSRAAKSAAETVESALIAIVLVFLIIKPFIVQAFYIPSTSMLPTLRKQDHILVNKFIYRFREPRYGDIIVFKCPPEASTDGEEKDFIKRLVGRSDDVLEVKAGSLYRNGSRVKEPYLNELQIDYEMEPLKVPEGMLFVMGDNRNCSNDSHAWGPLNRDRVLGKATVTFWPLHRMGVVH